MFNGSVVIEDRKSDRFALPVEHHVFSPRQPQLSGRVTDEPIVRFVVVVATDHTHVVHPFVASLAEPVVATRVAGTPLDVHGVTDHLQVFEVHASAMQAGAPARTGGGVMTQVINHFVGSDGDAQAGGHDDPSSLPLLPVHAHLRVSLNTRCRRKPDASVRLRSGLPSRPVEDETAGNGVKWVGWPHQVKATACTEVYCV